MLMNEIKIQYPKMTKASGKLVYMILLGVVVLTISCKSSVNQESDDRGVSKVEAMYWMEDSDEEIFDYFEKEAVAKFVMNSGQMDADQIYQLKDVDQAPLFQINCQDRESPWKCSEQTALNYINHAIEWPLGHSEFGGDFQFIIRMDGKATIKDNHLSQNTFCTGCREAAVHVIENMPRWIPGIKNGQPVSVLVTIPVQPRIMS